VYNMGFHVLRWSTWKKSNCLKSIHTEEWNTWV
jgi:hypothetical protein